MSVIAAWHDLLTPDVAADTHAHLESELTRRGLTFGGRPLCTVLRPRLLTMAQVAGMQQRVAALSRAFGKASAHALRDREFRAQFGLLDWEEVLLASPLRYGHASPTSRLDFFDQPSTGGLALTENNAETPAGAAYVDALSDIFLDTRVLREFAASHTILPMPARHGVVGAVLQAWREFHGGRQAPRIGILDWDDVPTYSEFELYQQHFATLGLEAVIDDPRRCEYREGRLWSRGKPIDLIYKRVLISELIETCGIDHDVVRAVRDGAVCLVDGFHCKILHKKASLAVLSDDANAFLFDAADLDAIHACIPWTRVVSERTSVHGGRTIDLIPFILAEKDRLVLKPNDDYGGKGITLGWTVDGTEWERAVQEALASPFIVQERVEIPAEPFPSWVDGRLEVYDRMYDTAPFVTNGATMDGLLTRLSTAKLLNVTAGGGSTVPAFVVHPRS